MKNSMHVSVLLIWVYTVKKNVGPDPDPNCLHNVGPDPDPNCWTLMVFMKEFFGKVHFEKKSDIKKARKITQ